MTSDVLPDLTEKQKQAFKLCMKATSEENKTKRQLTEEIIEQGIYSRRYLAKKTLKFLLRNQNIPLEGQGEKVVNVA